MLILAGVTIVAISGENGILTRAIEAKNKTEESQEKEGVELALLTAQIGDNGYQELNQINLQKAIDELFKEGKTAVAENGNGTFIISFIDSKRDYIIDIDGIIKIIYWDEIMKNAEPHSQQTTQGVIGLDSNGNSVNMDLWEYTLNNETYALNDIEDIEDVEGKNETKGYLGKIIDGKIQGTIPKYIKTSTDKEFIPVTSLKDTFINLNHDFDELTITPVIPSLVTNMQSTFSRCSNLENVTNISPNTESLKWTFYQCTSLQHFNASIPNNVTNMQFTFNGCTSLQNFDTLIPDSVTNMESTFSGCTSLQNFDALIPNSVTNMESTFDGCTNLQNFNSSIPNNVINMFATFSQCQNLTYLDIIIPKSVTNLQYTFGNCLKLSGSIEINANVTGQLINSKFDYIDCFGYSTATQNNAKIVLSGSCPVLEEIVSNAKTHDINSNIVIKN